jgi:UDP-glucose 4-epimerase
MRMVGTGPQERQILIIGWGFLGAAIGNRLLADGLIVTGLTRSATGRSETARQAGARIVVGDARQRDVLEDALRDVDHVVFCAGGVTPPSAASDPPQAAAAMLPPLLAVTEALSTRPHVGLTYLSSGGAVYGDPEQLPVDEGVPPLPISPYGALHLCAELCAHAYARRFGMPLNILRCANVYGPGQAYDRDQGVIAIFLDRISRGLPITVFGDGSALRDYVLVDDVASAVAHIVEHRIDVGTVNVGSGQGHTVLEVVDAISQSIGKSPIVDPRPRRGFDVRSVVLDITRLSSLIPYAPTTFHRGLAMTAAEYSRRQQLQADPARALDTRGSRTAR